MSNTLASRYYYSFLFFFFFNDTATTEIYTLSLHDALPISFASSPGITRCFCQQCGSSLTWHSAHYAEGAWISVALATLDSELVVGGQRHVNRGVGMGWVDWEEVD